MTENKETENIEMPDANLGITVGQLPQEDDELSEGSEFVLEVDENDPYFFAPASSPQPPAPTTSTTSTNDDPPKFDQSISPAPQPKKEISPPVSRSPSPWYEEDQEDNESNFESVDNDSQTSEFNILEHQSDSDDAWVPTSDTPPKKRRKTDGTEPKPKNHKIPHQVEIHQGFSCDSCSVEPIRGPRHTCKECLEEGEGEDTFDLCDSCLPTKGAEHEELFGHSFVRMPCLDVGVTSTGRRKRKDAGMTRVAGRPWDSDEIKRFEEALELYGRDWKKCAAHVETRDERSFTSRAQRHFITLFKSGLPLPAKVAESGTGYTLSGAPLSLSSSSAQRIFGTNVSTSKSHKKRSSGTLKKKERPQRATAGKNNSLLTLSSPIVTDSEEEGENGIKEEEEESQTENSPTKSPTQSSSPKGEEKIEQEVENATAVVPKCESCGVGPRSTYGPKSRLAICSNCYKKEYQSLPKENGAVSTSDGVAVSTQPSLTQISENFKAKTKSPNVRVGRKISAKSETEEFKKEGKRKKQSLCETCGIDPVATHGILSKTPVCRKCYDREYRQRKRMEVSRGDDKSGGEEELLQMSSGGEGSVVNTRRQGRPKKNLPKPPPEKLCDVCEAKDAIGWSPLSSLFMCKSCLGTEYRRKRGIPARKRYVPDSDKCLHCWEGQPYTKGILSHVDVCKKCYGKEYRAFKAQRDLPQVIQDMEQEAVQKFLDQVPAAHRGTTSPNWLQCSQCLRWRPVPSQLFAKYPEGTPWTCGENINLSQRTCADSGSVWRPQPGQQNPTSSPLIPSSGSSMEDESDYSSLEEGQEEEHGKKETDEQLAEVKKEEGDGGGEDALGMLLRMLET